MTDSYIGVPPQSGFISQEANQYFTGLTQNYIDLNQSISSLSSVIILVNGVVQENSTMSLTSSTRITLGDTLVSADKVTCIYVAKISSTQAPAIGSVTSDMLSGSIANSKLATDPLNASNLASGTVPTARLGSGTASSSNFLRGDGSWQTAGGVAGTESFLARESSTQTVQDNVYTQVSFSTEVFDTGNNFSSNTFTAPSSGVYYLFTNVSIAGTSSVAMSHFVSLFYKNNAALDYFRTVYQDEVLESIMIQQTLSAVIDLSANDTIKVYAKGNANNNTVRFLDKVFGGFKIA